MCLQLRPWERRRPRRLDSLSPFLGAPTSPSAGLMIPQADEDIGRADEEHPLIDSQ